MAEEAEVDLEVHEAMIEEEAVVVDMDTKVRPAEHTVGSGSIVGCVAGTGPRVSRKVEGDVSGRIFHLAYPSSIAALLATLL